MGEVNSIIRLYRHMRFAMLISIPLAASLFFYALTGNPFLSALAFVTAFLSVLEETPEPKEIRRTLKQKDFRSDQIVWYMIEDRVTGETRMM